VGREPKSPHVWKADVKIGDDQHAIRPSDMSIGGVAPNKEDALRTTDAAGDCENYAVGSSRGNRSSFLG
jgi:hypothetical protein